MRRILGVLLILCLLPCTAWAQELWLMEEHSLQADAAVDYLQEVQPLPNGNLLVRYYTQEPSASGGSAEETLYGHHNSIFTPEGQQVWTMNDGSYALAREENVQQMFRKPESFVWEYYPSGTPQEYCWTEYDLDGNVLAAELDLHSRDWETYDTALPNYTLRVNFREMEMWLDCTSLTTGAEAQIHVDGEGTVDLAEIAGHLAVLTRVWEENAVIRFYDENMQEAGVLPTPIGHGEIVQMAWDGSSLYCFAMYAGDWESYCVYICDLATGHWQEEVPFVLLPNEYCSLWEIIPCEEGFLLLIDEGNTQEHPAPFGPYNWNYTDKNLYYMAEDGTLSPCLDLNGDARLLPQTQRDRFTLLMRSETTGEYVLRTYALVQELPMPE